MLIIGSVTVSGCDCECECECGCNGDVMVGGMGGVSVIGIVIVSVRYVCVIVMLLYHVCELSSVCYFDRYCGCE